MRPTRGFQARPSGLTARLRSFDDLAAFHVGNLSENGEDDLASSATDGTDAVDVDHDSGTDETTNRALNVECITTKAIDGVDMDGIALADLLQQLSEAGAIRRHDAARYTDVTEFLIESTAESVALRIDRLIARRNPKIRDLHGVAHKLGATLK
ncbi:MAG: hypothetical protein P4L76_05265 [Beijerinckiaceae bacterium]|nr:hypothetical protein [Beijerinckiaceae bacterium]